MILKDILSAHLVEHFREMLLEHSNEVIDVYYAPLSYCGEVEVYWEPWAVPK